MRSLDIDFFNGVANDALVRPWLGGNGPLDMTPLIRNLDNFAFKNEQGGFLVQYLTGGIYECHTLFKPRDTDFHGVVELMKLAQAFMFVHTPCADIVTILPEGNRGAEVLAKLGGFRHIGDRMWEGNPAKVMRLELDAWARVWYGTLEAGYEFHKMLEDAKPIGEAHVDDPLHNRMVGAAVLMIKAGNLAKGVNLYNRWATAMGWNPVTVMAEHPVVVNTGDALIQLSDRMEVLEMPIGAALGGAAITGGATMFAASKAQQGSNAALGYQKQIRSDVQPWVQGGISAYNNLSNPNQLMKNFYTSPNYQFTMKQGLNAVGTDAAVNGLLKSGGALKGLTNYASNLAAGQLDNYVGQQQYLSSAGLNAEGIASGSANQSSNIAMTNSANLGNAGLAMGNGLDNLLGKLTANYPPPGGGTTGSSYGGVG